MSPPADFTEPYKLPLSSGKSMSCLPLKVFTNHSPFFKKISYSVIFFNISPPLKIVIPPPLWETTMPTAWVTLVIAAN